MIEFSIVTKIKDELEKFNESVSLSRGKSSGTARYLNKNTSYQYNQLETINMIDRYLNSQFEDGPRDSAGQTKLFLNIGKFRAEVASKQIDIDTKDFRFIPEDYASTWPAFFMQKEFGEWAKNTYFGELVNQIVESYPRYGTVVLKKVGKELKFVPLQLLKNDQSADTLKTADFVIEEHPKMQPWEIKAMKEWNTDGIGNEPIDVYERYGRVPVWWLKRIGVETMGADDELVDAVVIVGWENTKSKDPLIFFAEMVKERPYEEAHWGRQHGRWLGVGVIEELFEDQKAKNIIANLYRRSLHWSSRKVFQTTTSEMTGKNLLASVGDGDVIEVGPSGDISQVDMGNKSVGEFNQFLEMWEQHADQTAFTYEVATGESLPSGTPFRLGVVLSNAVNSYFQLKREKLGLFLERSMMEFMVPQFLREMGNKERVIAMFSDEEGFETVKAASVDFFKGEVIRNALLSGEPVDMGMIDSAIEPFAIIEKLFFNLPDGFYKDAKTKFNLDVTGEDIDIEKKMQSLGTLYQLLAQQGDRRAEKVLARLSALGGEDVSRFGPPQPVAAPLPPMESGPPKAQA